MPCMDIDEYLATKRRAYLWPADQVKYCSLKSLLSSIGEILPASIVSRKASLRSSPVKYFCVRDGREEADKVHFLDKPIYSSHPKMTSTPSSLQPISYLL